MSIFNKDKPNDVLFLMPVRLAGEKPSRGRVRMLYSDAAGDVYTALVNKSVYERARQNAAGMEKNRRPFATIGLETGPGQFLPVIVEVGNEEVWALEHILEHAVKKGKLPDILKQYLKPIIKLAADSRETLLAEHKKRRRLPEAAVPRVLERLPYYPRGETEYSMPIYKAEYTYPLTVLKRLPPGGKDAPKTRRLLILDCDGDAAVIEVPFRLADEMEKGLKEYHLRKNRNVCAVVYQGADGLAVDYLRLGPMQRKALDDMTKNFEETGYGKQPISAAARAVLTRARSRTA
jgi:hypothetical protein